MFLSPPIASLTNIAPENRIEVDKKMAKMVDRLLTETCFNETRAANKYEGHDALGTAFRQLAGIPVREMMKDPAVAKGIATYGKYLDPKRLEKMFEDTKPSQYIFR